MDVRQGISSRRLILSGVDQGYDRPQDGGRVDVYAEDLELKDVAIQTGSVRYTRSVRFHGNVTTFGAITKEKLFDFQTAEDHLNDLQFKLLDYPVNGSTNRVCETDGKNCTLTLAGNNRILNRFQVEERDLINLKFLKVRVPEKSTAVVLLQSKDVHFRNVRVEAPQESIWTLGLPGGKFKVEFMELPGTVVLLSSAFELDRALLTGRVLSKTFSSPDCFEDGSCSTIDSSSLPGRICL
ncbi:MAG: hypothetical protein H7301_10565 [Cryobacterium sp.]|nr:hypothetical protein [Oligoflexia bacterium]